MHPRVLGRERLVQQSDSPVGLSAGETRCRRRGLAVVLGLPPLHPPHRNRRRLRIGTLRVVGGDGFILPLRPGRHCRSHHCLLLQPSSPLLPLPSSCSNVFLAQNYNNSLALSLR